MHLKGKGFLQEKELADGLALAELVLEHCLKSLAYEQQRMLDSIMLAWDGYQGSRELKGEQERACWVSVLGSIVTTASVRRQELSQPLAEVIVSEHCKQE